MSSTTTMVDVNIPRFNQTLVALLTGVGFVLDVPALIAFTFAVLAISVIGGPRLAPFTRLYTGLIRPRLRPDGPTEFEPAAPPRFAQVLGTGFLGLATVFLYAGATTVGWTLVLVVTALATLAATARICVGCLIYERAWGS